MKVGYVMLLHKLLPHLSDLQPPRFISRSSNVPMMHRPWPCVMTSCLHFYTQAEEAALARDMTSFMAEEKSV